MENNIQVQKAADISSLAGVVIVSLSALTAKVQSQHPV